MKNKLSFVAIFIVLVALVGLYYHKDIGNYFKKIFNSQSDGISHKQEILKNLPSLQVPFVENQGQWDKEVLYKAKTFAGSFFITRKGEMVYDIPKYTEDREDSEKNQKNQIESYNKKSIIGGVVIKESLVNSKDNRIIALDESITEVSYFKGNNPSLWKKGLRSYKRISYGEVYPFIELQLKAYGNNIEKLFYIKPGGEVENIRIQIEGVDKIEIDEKGQLILETPYGEVVFTKPRAYYKESPEEDIEVSYVLYNFGEYGFSIKDYDKTRTLIIDPLLASTYIGGSGRDEAKSLAIDSSGNVYIMGYTLSNNYPTTRGAYDTTYNGGDHDIFISKLNSDLTQLLASTYIGGSGDDWAGSLAIDSSGNVYIMGYTLSNNYPTTRGAYDTTYNGGDHDIFISKLNSDLTQLLASTYIGGSGDDWAGSLAIDSSGNVYITGGTESTNYPTRRGAYDTTHNGGGDVYISKLNSNLTQLLASTYIGGSGSDGASSLAIDSSGNVYITGKTSSNNYPTTRGAYDTTYNDFLDIFISKLNSNLTRLLASTYIGGSGIDVANSLAIDSSGNVYIRGDTASTNYPTTTGTYDTSFNGLFDVYISKLNSNLTRLLASTYIGGSGDDWAGSLAIDSSGNVYITGGTLSNNYPTTTGAYDTTYNGGDQDIFISKLNSNLTQLLASTYIGGSGNDEANSLAIDSSGNVYITGKTSSNNYPTTTGAYDTTHDGGDDIFISKLNSDLTSGTGSLYTLTVSISGSGVVITNPAGINCGSDCSEEYTENQIVTLMATPSSGYVFSGWNGNSDCSDGQITMDADKTCIAIFNVDNGGSGNND
ncbi:MAG: hypothetical protein KatS3mg129_1807 [Leptospiraceae bacterium]|nr:MAG: hypothetical protein KatS3mg129_1807 [Leptospiraceae bacterium]